MLVAVLLGSFQEPADQHRRLHLDRARETFCQPARAGAALHRREEEARRPEVLHDGRQVRLFETNFRILVMQFYRLKE